jgi:hypothetical protein
VLVAEQQDRAGAQQRTSTHEGNDPSSSDRPFARTHGRPAGHRCIPAPRLWLPRPARGDCAGCRGLVEQGLIKPDLPERGLPDQCLSEPGLPDRCLPERGLADASPGDPGALESGVDRPDVVPLRHEISGERFTSAVIRRDRFVRPVIGLSAQVERVGSSAP